MRTFKVFTLALISILIYSCTIPKKHDNVTYNWLGYEKITQDSLGRTIGKTQWITSHLMPSPGDSFTFYNNDSILMRTPGTKEVDMFKRITIRAKKWKPQPRYGNALLFIGTYIQKGLPGMYISFYTTKDQSCLMQLVYTNPGNLTDVLFFSADSVNILQKQNIIIDPQKEIREPEEAITSLFGSN